MARLTEEALERSIDRHAEQCLTCEAGEQCDDVERIESSFWSEVDRKVDEYRESREYARRRKDWGLR